MALFNDGKTVEDKNPGLRETYGIMQMLLNLFVYNLETLNAHFINEGLPSSERLAKLNQTAIVQMKLLTADTSVKRIEEKKLSADGADSRR